MFHLTPSRNNHKRTGDAMINFKKIYVRCLTCALALVFIGGTFVSLIAGEAINLRTGTSYDNLQQAIDNAISDDILQLTGIFSGSFQILEKSLTLQGTSNDPMQAGDILSGNQNDRVLEIKGTSSENPSTVNLKNLAIINGWATGTSNYGGSGGGILAVYTTLTVTDLYIANNRADTSGGGIAALYTTLKIQSSAISGNTAATGGGVNNLICDTIISDSIISSNTVTQDGGGGILSNGNRTGTSSLVITYTIITGNQSVIAGGGLFNSLLSITKCTNCHFTSNTAVVGGGIYNAESLSFNNGLIIRNSTISSDLYLPNGGGVYNSASASSATFSNSTIEENSAVDNGNGGGIYNATKQEKLDIVNTQIINNTPDNIYQQ